MHKPHSFFKSLGHYLAGFLASLLVSATSYANLNLALDGTVTASSERTPPASTQKLAAQYAIDGDMRTRWSSEFSDAQWLRVDLGARQWFNKVVLKWEAAYGRAYRIEVSDDDLNWRTVYTQTNGVGNTETINFPGVVARYVRLMGLVRGTSYGYSLWEMEIGENLAKSKSVLASGGASPEGAIDELNTTAWMAPLNGWLRVDVRQNVPIGRVKLIWGANYPQSYAIETSSDGQSWLVAYATTRGQGGQEIINLAGSVGPFVRLSQLAAPRRSTGGMQLIEMALFQGTELPVYQQTVAGEVLVDAALFHARTPYTAAGTTHEWQRVFIPGYQGIGAVQAIPEIGYAARDYRRAPRLGFNINFNRAGVHYLWLRGKHSNDANKSVHIGLDGVASTDGPVAMLTAAGCTTGGDYCWTNRTSNGLYAKVNIPSAGVHTLHIWMYGDGVIVDSLALSHNPDYIPTGAPDLIWPKMPPTNVSARGYSRSEMDVSWTAAVDNVGIVNYQIYRDGQLLPQRVSTTYFRDSGLTGDTTYSYQIVGVDARGNRSPKSDIATGRTLSADTQAPTAPGWTKVEALNLTSARLEWTAATDNVGVTGYNIYRNGQLLAPGLTALSYTDTTAGPDSRLRSYQIEAYDAALNKQLSVSRNPTDQKAPGLPGNVSATPAGAREARITWSAASDNFSIKEYVVYRDGNPLTPPSRLLSYLDGGLTEGRTYRYAVMAYDEANLSSPLTPSVSVTLPDVTAPGLPLNLRATAQAGRTIHLTWTAAADNSGSAVSYKIYLGGSSTPLATIPNTEFSVRNLLEYTSYTFEVQAVDVAGNGTARVAVTARTLDETAPNAPGLSLTAPSPGRVKVEFTTATDPLPGSGVIGYRLYRNNDVLVPLLTLSPYYDDTVVGNTTYEYSITAIDGAQLESARTSATITTLPAPSPVTNLYAPLDVWFVDRFEDGNPIITAPKRVYNELPLDRPRQMWWKNGSVAEADNVLTMNGGAIAGPVDGSGAPQPSYQYNFFTHPLRIELRGIALGSAGEAVFAVQANGSTLATADDAIIVRLSANGQVKLARKINGVETQLYQRSAAAQSVTDLVLDIDASSYQLMALAGANLLADVTGAHGIGYAEWGAATANLRRGDSLLLWSSAAGSVSLDELRARSLSFMDVFRNGVVSDAGHHAGVWSPTGNVSENSGSGAAIFAGAGGGHIKTALTRRYNFFGQELTFEGQMAVTGASQQAKFSLLSKTGNALTLTVNNNRTIQFSSSGSRTASHVAPAAFTTSPTSFSLTLTRSAYVLVLRDQNRNLLGTYRGDHDWTAQTWGGYGDVSLRLEGLQGAAWRALTVVREEPAYIRPYIYGPRVEGASLEVPPALGSQLFAQDKLSLGIVDVSKAPFYVDLRGAQDATEAMRHALTFAQQHYLTAFLPAGQARVTDTIECVQGMFLRNPGSIGNPAAHAMAYAADREGACVLTGARQNAAGAYPSILELSGNAPGFDNSADPRPVLYFWSRAIKKYGREQVTDDQPNKSYSQMIKNLHVRVGTGGNRGAVGIDMPAAQGTTIQDVKISANAGFAGIVGGAGSGGSNFGVEIVGGKYGIDYHFTQPMPVIAGFKFSEQRSSAILYSGQGPLTAVGIEITVPPGRTNAQDAAIYVNAPNVKNGQISLIDSRIEFLGAAAVAGSNVAINSNRPVYLQNVYVKGEDKVVNIRGLAGRVYPYAITGTGWKRIGEYATLLTAIDVPLLQGEERDFNDDGRADEGVRAPIAFRAPVYIDGVRQSGAAHHTHDIQNSGVVVPATLRTEHLWAETFPTFDDPQIINARAHNVTGDGETDDTANLRNALAAASAGNKKLWLPKGAYRISDTVVIPPGVQIIGIAPSFTSIYARGGSILGPNNTIRPLLKTTSGALNDAAALAFMTLHVPEEYTNLYAVHWEAGAQSIMRSVNFTLESYRVVQGAGNTTMVHPIAYITGSGGGKWYNFNLGTTGGMHGAFRHLKVENTRAKGERLRFYQLNVERGSKIAAKVEMDNTANIAVYGFKAEGACTNIWLRNSTNFDLYGNSGLATAPSYRRAYTGTSRECEPLQQVTIGSAGNPSAAPFDTTGAAVAVTAVNSRMPALFRVENSTNFRFVNLWEMVNTVGMAGNPGVDPLWWVMLLEGSGMGLNGATYDPSTKPYERPVLYRRGSAAR